MNDKTLMIQQTREQFIAHGLKCSARAKQVREDGSNGTFMVAHQQGGGMALIFVKGDSKTGVGPHLRFGPVWSRNIAKVTSEEVARWNRENPQHPVVRMPILSALSIEALKTFEMIQMTHDLEDKS